jgi:hypothetical protein
MGTLVFSVVCFTTTIVLNTQSTKMFENIFRIVCGVVFEIDDMVRGGSIIFNTYICYDIIYNHFLFFILAQSFLNNLYVNLFRVLELPVNVSSIFSISLIISSLNGGNLTSP